MLTRIFIQNVALIDKLEVEFGAGLNILTGETGAGKSIVIDSITALIGGRLSKELIRSGEEKAVVEGLFLINDDEKKKELIESGFDIEEDNCLLVVREFYQNGKNICRVNGRIVTVSMLKNLGDVLIDIHGQHDNQSLLEQSNHIGFLDSFIGDEISELKQNYTNKLNMYKNLKAELSGLWLNAEDRARKLDLMDFQIKEIESANLKIGEEEDLIVKRNKLANAEKIASTLSNSYEMLSGSDMQSNSIQLLLNNLYKELSQIASLDHKYQNPVNIIEEITYSIQEIGRDIRLWRDEVEFNPQLLNQLDERLDLISRLKRKYGQDIESILDYLDNLKKDYDNMLDSEEKGRILQDKIRKLNEELMALAKKLSEKRKIYGIIMLGKVEEELSDLEMKNTRFEVRIDFIGDHVKPEDLQFNKSGLDKVEFLISPNAGEPPKPLSKIASGGEMSRIMLAIKTILAKVDRKSVLIFDEIDTGISGKTGHAVAEKLAILSSSHQVICITHLAQIASMADFHFNIRKVNRNERTLTEVSLVSGDEEYKEIARIIGGANITDTTIKHAKEIKVYANSLKEELREKYEQ